MVRWFFLVLFLVLLIPLSGASDSSGVQWSVAAGKAFAELIRKESPRVWWDCGKKTPQAEWDARAQEIVLKTLEAMKTYDLNVNPVGVLAVGWNESRGNRCSIGPKARKSAKKLGLLPKGKTWREYNQQDLLTLLHDKRWISRGYKADIGLYQDVYPTYSRILDPKGDLQCLGKKRVPCRIPKPEELVTLEGSAAVGVHGMLARVYHFRTDKPWVFWPWRPRATYTRVVESTMKSMEKLIQKYLSEATGPLVS